VEIEVESVMELVLADLVFVAIVRAIKLKIIKLIF
jgi:hypothetical protein